MKACGRFLLAFALIASALGQASSAVAKGEESAPPNVVLILADDLGWSDTTLYGTTHLYRTPNVERLARDGMTFHRAYAASPICSPTRASILTGLHPARIGITEPHCHLEPEILSASLAASAAPDQKLLPCQSATRLDTSYRTLAETLREAGYATGHFGKWHLGPAPFSPLEQGFDVDFPHWPGPGPSGLYVSRWAYDSVVQKSPGEHIEDRVAEEAVAFLQKHRDQPFFLNYWQFSVHAPFDAKPEVVAAYRARIDSKSPQRSPTYAAMVEAFDDNVGRVLDALDRLELTDRTIVIFASDNGGNMYDVVDGGPPTSNAPLRGGKGILYEGGIRVPCVVRWPGKIAAGSRSEALVQTTDFYPTLLDLLQLPAASGQSFDGVSFALALESRLTKPRAIFTFFPHSPPFPDTLPPGVTVHRGDWKLIRLFHDGPDGAHRHLLHNLRYDPGETNDLSGEYPDLVTDLDGQIEDFLERTKAVVPRPNPQNAAFGAKP